jgi:hypothetical protein
MVMSHHQNAGQNHNLVLWNSWYHSGENLLSSHLLSIKLKIKIFRTMPLPIVLHGFKIWSLTLREEYISKVSENRVLRRIFRPKSNEMV